MAGALTENKLRRSLEELGDLNNTTPRTRFDVIISYCVAT
jgi:hypothetical protein